MQNNSPLPSPAEPIEPLHLRYARQCDALYQRKDQLFGLFDDLPSYRELMKGESISIRYKEAPVIFEDLSAWKDIVIQGLKRSIAAFEQIEQETDESFWHEKERLTGLIGRVTKEVDLDKIPSSSEIDTALADSMANLVQENDNTRERRDLVSRFQNTARLTKVTQSLKSHAADLTEPAADLKTFSQLLVATCKLAQKKRLEQLQPKVPAMRKIYNVVVQADKFAGQRDERLDIAGPVENLRRTIDLLESGNGGFFTATDCRRMIDQNTGEAYALVDTSPYRGTLEREKKGVDNGTHTPVTKDQTEHAGGKKGVLNALWNLLKKK